MKTTKYIFHFFIVFLVLSSCDMIQEVGDVPYEPPRPVLYAFISPEEAEFNFTLYYSKPYFNSDLYTPFRSIENATMKLNDITSGDSILIPYLGSSYYFTSNQFPIKAGHTYRLQAKFSDTVIWAICQVPTQKVSFTSVDATKFIQRIGGMMHGGGGGGTTDTVYRYNIIAKWNDLPNEKNYYSIGFQIGYLNGTDTAFSFDGDPKLLSDENNDGKELLITRTSNTERFSLGNQNADVEACFLLHCDRNFYEYHIRRILYQGGNDPFSEPVQMYSNVNNGLGCFGSYRKSQKSVQLP